ncbi:baeRF12 domain-containing protein [Faunimonas sp. B44]|uniref:baeRF12 domain-containing protein n=1 Tax=Faunimonas sp. B44 TaxID=3461493 RepID=UPI004043A455
MKIANEAWILVADGRKAIIIKNIGDELYPNLKVETVLEDENPPTRAQGADRPGRVHDSATERRSAVGNTDWHDAEEARFLGTVVARLEKLQRKGSFDQLLVVAPPRALAQLRTAMPDAVRRVIVAEIDKDLTKHPVGEIEKALVAH